MFMGRINSVFLYKHGLSRRYLNLGDDGRAFRYLGKNRFEEIAFEDALLWVSEPLIEMGETLETPYDDEYRMRRSAALRSAGWEELRVEVEPVDIVVQ